MRKGGHGWTDSRTVLSLVLLNLAGGDCVDDIKILEADDGFCEVLKKSEMHGLRRKVRRALLRRRRKEKTRAVPSASLILRYPAKFHDSEQEKLRGSGKAFIPAPNEYLQGFVYVNKELAYFSGSQGFESTVTLDMDATLAAINKTDALFSYKGYKAYQPLNTWWFEQGIVLHTEYGRILVAEENESHQVFFY